MMGVSGIGRRVRMLASASWIGARCLGAAVCAVIGLSGCMPMSVHERAPSISMLAAHEGSDTLAFDPVSGDLLSAGWDGELIRWQAPEFVQQTRWVGHTGPVEGVAFVDSRMVSAGREGLIKSWFAPNQMIAERNTASPITEMVAAPGMVVTGHMDGMVRAFALPGLEPLWEAQPHVGWIASLAVLADGSHFASAGADRQVRLYDRAGRQRSLPTAPSAPWSLAFSADGDWLYGGGFPELYRWQLPEGRLSIVDTPHYGQINGISTVPGTASLITISRTHDSSIIALEPESGTELERYRRLQMCGNAVAVSADGRFLAATGDAGNIHLWRRDRNR